MRGVRGEGAAAAGFISALSRTCLATIFIMGGISKLRQKESTTQYMRSNNLPAAGALLPVAAGVEILGGVSVLAGLQAKAGASLLAAYLIPTTLVFHRFWAAEDEGEQEAQMIQFMKNLAIIGGLLSVVTEGSEQFSFDARRRPRQYVPFRSELDRIRASMAS